jgi:hypothetical protein
MSSVSPMLLVVAEVDKVEELESDDRAAVIDVADAARRASPKDAVGAM